MEDHGRVSSIAAGSLERKYPNRVTLEWGKAVAGPRIGNVNCLATWATHQRRTFAFATPAQAKIFAGAWKAVVIYIGHELEHE